MKVIKNMCSIIFIFMMFLTFVPFADSVSNFNVSLIPIKNEFISGKAVQINIEIDNQTQNPVGAFLMEISFDNKNFSFNKLNTLNGVTSSEITNTVTGSVIKLVYCDNDVGTSPIDTGKTQILQMDFLTTTKTELQSYDFTIKTCSFSDIAPNFITVDHRNDATVKVVSPPSNNAELKSLSLETATLSPTFSAAIEKYKATVNPIISQVQFNFETAEKDAFVRVSRKNLNKQGETTNINITVTAPDQITKRVYIVSVYREKEDSSSKGSVSSDSNSKNKVNSSSKNTSSKKSSSKTDKSESFVEISLPPKSKNYAKTSSNSVSTELEPTNTTANNRSVVDQADASFIKQNGFVVFLIGFGGGIFILLLGYLILKKANDNNKK